MLSKRGAGYSSDEVPPEKRLRANLSDLFLSNDISATRARSLFEDADAAHAEHCGDLSAAGSRGRFPGNVHRDLMRRLCKGSRWPPAYWAPIRVWGKKEQREVQVFVPLWLPHEVAYALRRHGHLEALLKKSGMCAVTQEHMQRAEEELATPNLLGVGVWGDSMPCNWDRSKSVFAFTMNLPGLEGVWSKMRIPLFAMGKEFMVKRSTIDDVCSVLCWSFVALAAGAFPCGRHDMRPWLSSDAWRKKHSGTALQIQGVLAEVRGDWAYMKEAFGLPQHNESEGCCWRCTVTPSGDGSPMVCGHQLLSARAPTLRRASVQPAREGSDGDMGSPGCGWSAGTAKRNGCHQTHSPGIRDVGEAAPWRHERLDHWTCLRRIRARLGDVSPLFGCPALRTSAFLLDWLHVVDLGVAADVLGNIFKMLLPKYTGTTDGERCEGLFLEMQAYYRETKVDSQFDNLHPRMFAVPNKPPKLRGKAAEVRHAVPFAAQAASRLLSREHPLEEAAINAVVLLHTCYQMLSSDSFDAQVLARSCRRLALLLVALEQRAHQPDWRVKPKLHLMQELCEVDQSRPSTCWLYRDEDFGGSVAHLSRRRGGANRPHTTGWGVLRRFMAKHKLPSIA